MPTFQEIVRVADAIAAAGSKLDKTRLLAGFLSTLPDHDLYWATLYFTGNAFAPGSGRVMQAGFAMLQGALQNVTGTDGATLSHEYSKWSDVGDPARVLFAERGRSSHLSIAQLAARLDQAAATPAGHAKSVVVADLFRQPGPDEARYAAMILTADLHVGLKEGPVEDPVAQACGVMPAEVRKGLPPKVLASIPAGFFMFDLLFEAGSGIPKQRRNRSPDARTGRPFGRPVRTFCAAG